MTKKPILYGALAGATLLGVYFVVLSLVSGWNYALDQFYDFWYFVVSLAVGFGIQIALYQYIKNLVHDEQDMRKIVEVSGTTSTVAMLSCCTHYLVNLVPILGVTGLVTLVTQYQVELFWIGLIFNIVGIGYMISRIIKLKRIYG
jgi:Cu+-exporting ATPase